MKRNTIITMPQAICFAGICLLASCSSDLEETSGILSANTLEVEAITQGYVDEEATDTRATTTGFKTTFAVGDEMGLIVVRSGSAMTQYNNLKLTYEGSGKWKAPTTIYAYDGASYIGYFPYRSDMTGKASIDAIKSAYPIQSDQSTLANFNASNLLTSAGTLSSGVLSFNFTPAFAMVEVRLPKTAIQGYSNGNGENYTYNIYGMSSDAAVSFNPTFCSIGNDKSYFRVIKPATDMPVTVTYSKANLKFSKTKNVKAGYRTWLGLETTVNRNLQAGDFVYGGNGGTLAFLPGSTTVNAPDQSACVGVVAYMGNVDGYLYQRNEAYRHGSVVCKSDATSSKVTSAYLHLVVQYSPSAPAGTSGWYLPKNDELQYLCSGSPGSEGTGLRDKLNSYLSKAGGSEWQARSYWTSEADKTTYLYWSVVFFSNGKIGRVGSQYQSLPASRAECPLRGSFAF